ncbi:MAG: YciI family protein [Gemmobacter sp.]
MRVALICRDRPGALEVRKANRQAHLDYIAASGIVEMAGPLIENGEMAGSLLILSVEGLDEAKAWAAGDPYAVAGLFDNVTMNEWRKVIG